MFKLFSLTIILLLTGMLCLSQSTQGKTLYSKYNLTDTLLSDWKKDKKGCLHLRSRYMDEIPSNASLKGISKREVLKLFGKPDERSRNYITYLVASTCDKKGNILKEAERAWLVFQFENGELQRCLLQIQ